MKRIATIARQLVSSASLLLTFSFPFSIQDNKNKECGILYFEFAGPYCGAGRGISDTSLLLSSHIEIYFYSDTRSGSRIGGQVRARIYVEGNFKCGI